MAQKKKTTKKTVMYEALKGFNYTSSGKDIRINKGDKDFTLPAGIIKDLLAQNAIKEVENGTDSE